MNNSQGKFQIKEHNNSCHFNICQTKPLHIVDLTVYSKQRYKSEHSSKSRIISGTHWEKRQVAAFFVLFFGLNHRNVPHQANINPVRTKLDEHLFSLLRIPILFVSKTKLVKVCFSVSKQWYIHSNRRWLLLSLYNICALFRFQSNGAIDSPHQHLWHPQDTSKTIKTLCLWMKRENFKY